MGISDVLLDINSTRGNNNKGEGGNNVEILGTMLS